MGHLKWETSLHKATPCVWEMYLVFEQTQPININYQTQSEKRRLQSPTEGLREKIEPETTQRVDLPNATGFIYTIAVLSGELNSKLLKRSLKIRHLVRYPLCSRPPQVIIPVRCSLPWA